MDDRLDILRCYGTGDLDNNMMFKKPIIISLNDLIFDGQGVLFTKEFNIRLERIIDGL